MEAPDVPPPAEMRFRTRLATRWSDEDNQKVLNNAIYLTLLEECRHRYFGALGLLEDNQFPFVLLQSNVRFLRPGTGGADVLVECRTTHVGGKSFVQAYRVSPSDGGEPWCEAEAVLVGWDGALKASRPLTDRFRRAILELEDGPPAPLP